MKVRNALGMLEIVSIPKGIETGDAMLKAADVLLVEANPVCAGKYIIIVTGEVAAVKASIEAGIEVSGMKLIDQLIIPNIDPQVPRAINMCNDYKLPEAVGSVELFSLCATLVAADAAVKTADVRLLEVRLARGLGGKGFFTMTGETADVEAAVRAVKELDVLKGLISECVVIPQIHPEMAKELV
jgi:microcompartment protein CcmL/EutN